MFKLGRMVVGVILFSMILLGCSSVNRDNFDKIKMGMDYQQVVEIIGKPDKCDAAFGAKNCIWGNDSKNITVKFVGGKVALPTMKGL